MQPDQDSNLVNPLRDSVANTTFTNSSSPINLKQILLEFAVAGAVYKIREFQTTDVPTLDAIAERIAADSSLMQFYLLKGDKPGAALVARAQAEQGAPRRAVARLAVSNSSQELVGYACIDLIAIEAEGSIEYGDIGYFIDPKFKERGVATQAIFALLDRVAFKLLQFPKVDVTVDPGNTRSIFLLQRLGAKINGQRYWADKYQAYRQKYIIDPNDFYSSEAASQRSE